MQTPSKKKRGRKRINILKYIELQEEASRKHDSDNIIHNGQHGKSFIQYSSEEYEGQGFEDKDILVFDEGAGEDSDSEMLKGLS